MFIKEEMKQFDDNFSDGVYAIPHSEHPKVKVRALHDYCKSKGVTPQELSPEEMKRFVVS